MGLLCERAAIGHLLPGQPTRLLSSGLSASLQNSDLFEFSESQGLELRGLCPGSLTLAISRPDSDSSCFCFCSCCFRFS